jgi:hypothetical protein
MSRYTQKIVSYFSDFNSFSYQFLNQIELFEPFKQFETKIRRLISLVCRIRATAHLASPAETVARPITTQQHSARTAGPRHARHILRGSSGTPSAGGSSVGSAHARHAEADGVVILLCRFPAREGDGVARS